jgi:bifunctional ADP-heptose synthase (sugar kinase/adenylyltransferase)
MAVTYKVLAQSAPAATTNTDVYTVGSGKSAIISTMTICNRSGSGYAYRVAVRPAGASLADQHYIVYDAPVGAGDTVTLTLGLTLAATDVVTVYVAAATISISLFGSEIS